MFKKFKNLKIGTQLLVGFFLVVLTAVIMFYIYTMMIFNSHFEGMIKIGTDSVQTDFNNLKDREINLLSSSLHILIQDPAIKGIYLEKDREKLYAHAKLLFEDFKNKYNITHWYFILPDGHVFLRVHDKNLFGDEVVRPTFLKARDTQTISSGIDLGKTAYALRVVAPYYNNGQLIGYMELGEDINYFLDILKKKTGDDFSLIADKEFLSKNDWASVRQVAGLRNNWDDLPEHLMIANTAESKITSTCFLEDNLEKIEKGELLIMQVQEENNTYRCIGFGLNNIKGQHIGSILSAMDIDGQLALAQKLNIYLGFLAAALFIVMFLLSIVISYFISSPIKNFNRIIQIIAGGDLSKRVVVESKNEIGELANSFNKLLENLQKEIIWHKKAEEELEIRAEELAESNKDLNATKLAILNLLEDARILEEKFKGLVESSQDCIKIFDINGKLLFLSKGGLEEHGFKTAEEALIWDYLATIKEGYAPKIKEALKQALKGDITSIDVEHKQEKGIIGRSNREWCNMTFSPLRGAQGEIINVLAVSRDITGHKKLEEELRKEKENVESKVVERTRELKEEQARLAASINSLPIGLALTDKNDNILFKNQVFQSIFAFLGSEISRMDSVMAAFSNDADLKEAHRLCMEEKRMVEIKSIVLKNKFFRLFLAPVIMLRDSREVIGHLFLIEDITEAKVIERSREEFFAVASHELRTPLTAIRGNMAMIKDLFFNKLKDKDAREMINDSYDASVRLIGIVNDFLDISRLEQNKVSFTKERVDIGKIIDETIHETESLVKAKNLYLKLKDKKGVSLFVLGDEGRMRQVISNLLGNAINYTKTGGITLEVKKQGKFLKVLVSDTGMGIAPENQTLLFRKFQQAGEKILVRDVTKGTGLGLYISKLIIEGMGGQIGLEKSVLGEGSVFFFTLPVASNEENNV